MKIKIIALGKIKEKYLKDGINEFLKRLTPYASVSVIELSPIEIKDENLKEEKGAALKEELVNDDMWVAAFDNIKVIYHYETDTNTVGHFMWAQIDNAEHKFGEQQLAVGMSRETIEKALKNSKRPKPCILECELFDSEGNVYKGITEDYYDDEYEYGMGFVFDEEDYVKYIRIYIGL